ncbi:hypothetical protein MS3_00009656 [Schistosoma haematobium]|uniref:Uncharacterized protein n=2 Tax=Schistosoma TaxID=6181 RepID=A0A094ZF86_SCHHA|nr:hypothetical protein MS3_00009656 [Schistosoma haematobium]KAH9579540.1 hypothetical protein MS3_00009656 [Schistosoma haematobium]CAH8596159.1 unnamed protein product [Schistosoma mattheei]
MGSKIIALIVCLPLLLLLIALGLAIFYCLRSRKRIRQRTTSTPVRNHLPRSQPTPTSNFTNIPAQAPYPTGSSQVPYSMSSSQAPYPISSSQDGMPTGAAVISSAPNLDQPPPYPALSELPPPPPPYYSKIDNS